MTKNIHLSPAEKFVAIYEFVSNREYNKNPDFHNDSMRTWSGVLTDEYVICSGFSSLLTYICDQAFPKNELICDSQSCKIYSNDLESLGSHANNLVYINDPKYNLNGIYYADTCWDSQHDSKLDHKVTSLNFCLIPPAKICNYKGSKMTFTNALFFYNLLYKQKGFLEIDQLQNYNVNEKMRSMDKIKIDHDLPTYTECEKYDSPLSLQNDMRNQIRSRFDFHMDILVNKYNLQNLKNINIYNSIPTSISNKFSLLASFNEFLKNLDLIDITKEKIDFLQEISNYYDDNKDLYTLLNHIENDACNSLNVVVSNSTNKLMNNFNKEKVFDYYEKIKNEKLQKVNAELLKHNDWLATKEIDKKIYINGLKGAAKIKEIFSTNEVNQFVDEIMQATINYDKHAFTEYDEKDSDIFK